MCFIALVDVIWPSPVYAYIDPGNGSYILQILVAGTLGLLYAIKLFWTRIVDFLRGFPSRVARLMKW